MCIPRGVVDALRDSTGRTAESRPRRKDKGARTSQGPELRSPSSIQEGQVLEPRVL